MPSRPTEKVTNANPIPVKIRDPLVKYHPSDEQINYPGISYWGYLDKDGNWYIRRDDTPNGTFRYIQGANNYKANWANRANLNYDYFDEVF